MYITVYSQKDALEKDKLLYVRSAATHGVKFDDQGKVVKETKGFWIGALDFLKNCWKSAANWVGSFVGQTPYPVTSNHFGIDYSLEYNSPIDSKDHGHLYLYRKFINKGEPFFIVSRALRNLEGIVTPFW